MMTIKSEGKRGSICKVSWLVLFRWLRRGGPQNLGLFFWCLVPPYFCPKILLRRSRSCGENESSSTHCLVCGVRSFNDWRFRHGSDGSVCSGPEQCRSSSADALGIAAYHGAALAR